MSAGPFKAVLWDFGGVLSSSPFEAFARYEADRGLPRDFLRTVNATDPDTNAWAKLERSEVDLATFSDLFAAESGALGHRVAGHDVLGLLTGDVRVEMIDAVRALKRGGLLTALLTNNVVSGDEGGEAGWAASLRIDELFDVVIESSKAGVRKPDPAAYALVIEALGVDATEIVFLDDLGINLKPARAMGMTTIKVGDPAAALAELESLVGFSLRST